MTKPVDLKALPMKLANEKRPRKWIDYIGQGNNKGGVADLLKKAIAKNKHPGVLFITGPSGIGKTSIAKLYCRATLCPNRPESEYEPCGTCDVCLGTNVDNISEYTIKEATDFKDSIPQLLEYINSHPHTMSQRKDQYRRFIIIDELQNASRQAISALLDTLEFGPDTSTILLLSMDPEKLDAIVRDSVESRSIPLRLNSLTDVQIAEALGEHLGLDFDDAIALAFFCEGNMRRAWSYVEYFNILEEEITADNVYEKFAGGANQHSRNLMWGYMLIGDIDRLVTTFNGWSNAGANEELLANILLKDALYNDLGDELPLPQLCSLLGGWLKTTHKPPLVTVLIVLGEMMKMKKHDDEEKEIKILEYNEDGPSPNIAEILDRETKKACGIPDVFQCQTWSELEELCP